MHKALLLILVFNTVNIAQALLTGSPCTSRHHTETFAASRKYLLSFVPHPNGRHCSSRTEMASAATTDANKDGHTAAVAWSPTDRLSEYVTESSLVDYDRLAAQEKEWLAPVIESIKKTDPRKMEPSERHAFLINAYNLWTLYYVIRERRWPGWKGAVSTLAKARFFYWHTVSTGAGKRNLFNFENKVIDSNGFGSNISRAI